MKTTMESELLSLFNDYIKYMGGLTKLENDVLGNLIIYLNNIVNNTHRESEVILKKSK